MLVPMNKIDRGSNIEGMTKAQIRCANDLLRNASSRGLNYSERGFRQKLIDLLYNLGYYDSNKTIFQIEN